jgi:pyroglutamyl-peptidase
MTTALLAYIEYGEITLQQIQFIEKLMLLDESIIAGSQIKICSLPYFKQKSIDVLIRHIRTYNPRVVIIVDYNFESVEFTIERIALNMDDYDTTDAEGNCADEQPIVALGASGFWSTLPIKSIYQVLIKNNFPVSVSNSAGTFIGNHVFYKLMHFLEKRRKIRGGLIKVPQSGMNLDLIIKGLELVLATALTIDIDAKIGAGKLT